MFKAIDNYELEQFEYGFVVEDCCDEFVRVNIPKLMPLINSQETKEYNKHFLSNIFINTYDTKPKVKNTIKVRTFITVKRFNTPIMKNLVKTDKVICCIMNKNIRDMYITDFI